MSLPTSSKVSPLPVLHKKGFHYSAYLADSDKPITAGQIIQAVAFQKTIDITSGSDFYNGLTAQPVQASDIDTNGLKIFNDVTGNAEALSGTGRLEEVKILGVALTDCPINYGDRFSGTQDTTIYDHASAYGGMEIRKVTYATHGQYWLLYESTADLPTIGQAVQPSATEDGKVVACSDRANTITVGLVRGTAVMDSVKYVLVELTPDRW